MKLEWFMRVPAKRAQVSEQSKRPKPGRALEPDQAKVLGRKFYRKGSTLTWCEPGKQTK